METLLAGLIAFSLILGKTTVEKTGEKIVEVAWEQGGKLREKLGQKHPETLKKLAAAAEEPDVIDVEVLTAVVEEIKDDAEIKADLEALAQQVEAAARENAELKEKLRDLTAKLEAQARQENQGKVADKIANYFARIDNATFNQDFKGW